MEWKEATFLEKVWLETVRQAMASHGWTIDSTFDLARILRPAGTWNHKRDPKMPVRVLEDTGMRFAREDFEPFLNRHEYPEQTTAAPNVEFTLSADAEPPFAKFQALAAIERRFMDSWNRSRKDFSDQSPSTYDMSLANFAARADWTAQEIVDLLISSRRHAKQDLKLRPDYYARTVRRALESVHKEQAQEELETWDRTEVPTAQMLSEVLGFSFVRIIKYAAADPLYYLVCGDQRISLGDVDGLIIQRRLRSRVAALLGVYMPEISGKKWQRVAQMLLDMCEEESLGDANTEGGLVSMWLREYLANSPQMSNLEEAASDRLPFKQEDGLYIFLDQFRFWLSVTRAEHPTLKTLGAYLRAINCEPSIMYCVLNGKPTTREVWGLPETFG
jgi:hypothetical protein